MAKRGRPVKGDQLVEDLSGSYSARQRLRVILQTLAGALTVQQACAALGVRRSGFHKLRQQFLVRAAGLLEPRPRGRCRPEPSQAEIELAKLRQEVVQLKLDLKAQQIREQIALVMPHLLNSKRGAARKKTPRRITPAGSTRSVR
jgi:transposase-like protein